MTDPSLEPLPPELSALLEREKDAYPEHEAMKPAVLARVEMAIALGMSPGSGGPPSGQPGPAGSAGAGAAHANAAGSAVKAAAASRLVGVAVAAFLAGGVVGGAVMRATVHSTSDVRPTSSGAAVVTVVTGTGTGTAPATASAPPAASIPTMDVDDLESAAPSAVRAPGAASASAAKPAGDLTHEREIIDVARASLARRRPADALAAVERHAERWPRGYLAEEREVVRIQALVAEGRRREAAEYAAQFHALFPKSVLAPAVDAAMAADAGARTQ